MDTFLDSRARSDMEDESDDESFRDIGKRLGISNFMSTPESPTPPSSRASSQETGSAFSTPTRASKCSSPRRSPRRRPGYYLLACAGISRESFEADYLPWRKQVLDPGRTRDGFWRREAERLKMCAPKDSAPVLASRPHRQEDGEDTERLMTLAEVSLAELELEMSGLDLGPPEHQGFEVSSDRSTADWS
jgi:hypothetical protein